MTPSSGALPVLLAALLAAGPYIVETFRFTFGNASRTRSTSACGTAIPPMVAARIEEKS